jgi:hypothetical protein
MTSLAINPLSEDLHQLKTRWLMSPNHLSKMMNRVFMQPVVYGVESPDFLYKISTATGSEHLFTRPVSEEQLIDKDSDDIPSFEALDDFLDIGYQKVKAYLDAGTSADEITLHGQYFGGACVARIARRLHDEGHFVNINLERTFSRLSATLSPTLENAITTYFPEEAKEYAHYLTFGTSVASFSTFGASLGTGLAGLTTSIGILIGSLVANIGYYLAKALSVIPGLSQLASGVNAFYNATASVIHKTCDAIGSATGLLLGSLMSLTGALLGVVAGACLSLKLYLGHGHTNMPLGLPLRTLLNTTIGDLTPIDDVQYIQALNEHGHIKISNTEKDELVPPAVALNTAVGLSNDPNRALKPQGFGGNISSFWYKNTRIDEKLANHNIDHALTYDEPALHMA